MKENGYATKHMAEVSMNTLMELSTLEIGKKISRMATELKHGQIMLSMKVRMKMVKNMVSVHSNGQTSQFI